MHALLLPLLPLLLPAVSLQPAPTWPYDHLLARPCCLHMCVVADVIAKLALLHPDPLLLVEVVVGRL